MKDYLESTIDIRCQACTEYGKMSNTELYALLKERAPAVAETVGEVKNSNREKLVAFLKFLAGQPE